MKNLLCLVLASLIALVSLNTSFAEPLTRIALKEFLESISVKFGGKALSKTALESFEVAVKKYSLKYGKARTMTLITEGGIELLEAASRYGDDVIAIAMEASPGARRLLALNTQTLLPLAKKVGPEILELEVKAPGLAGRFVEAFGDDGARLISKNAPASDLPVLLNCAERADTPATRKLLLETYTKEGTSFLNKIPAKVILATGVAGGTIIVAVGAGKGLDKVGGGLGDGLENAGEGVKKALPETLARISRDFFLVAGAVFGGIGLFWIWLHYRYKWLVEAKKVQLARESTKV